MMMKPLNGDSVEPELNQFRFGPIRTKYAPYLPETAEVVRFTQGLNLNLNSQTLDEASRLWVTDHHH